MGTQGLTSVAVYDHEPTGISPADLAERAREFAVASRSAATLAAYDRDLRDFRVWASAHRLASMPATPETIAMYVTELAATYKPATITRRLSAISVAHQHGGHPTPTRDASVRSVMTGIRRTLGTAPVQVAPARIGEIRKMCARMTDSTIDRRDRAVLLLGFAGAFRRSELVALDVEDLADRTDGLLVTIRRSKRDQEGRGDTKAKN